MPDQILEDAIMHDESLPILSPDHSEMQSFTDAAAAVTRLEQLYAEATSFLARHFSLAVLGGKPASRFRAFYPEIRLSVTSHVKPDSRLSFGHVAGPGNYSTTITRPDLFRSYLIQQLELLMLNHGVAIQIATSTKIGRAHV